jgi:hypothetical protein
MVDLDRLETDLYNEIMEMRAKEKKRDEDRENTVKRLKFASVVGIYIIVSVLVLSLLFMFLRHQFPEYFTKGNDITKELEKTKKKETDNNITISNVSPVTQNVVINIYNNGVLSHVPINKYKDGNQTVVNIGKPVKKKKTIEELKKEILNDKSLTEEEKKKKILELFGTRNINYSGKFAENKKKSRICNNSVVDSVNSANIALKAYDREDLNALTTAITATEKKNTYSNQVCKNIMSNEQLNESINTGNQHLKLLRQYEKILKSKSSNN